MSSWGSIRGIIIRFRVIITSSNKMKEQLLWLNRNRKIPNVNPVGMMVIAGWNLNVTFALKKLLRERINPEDKKQCLQTFSAMLPRHTVIRQQNSKTFFQSDGTKQEFYIVYILQTLFLKVRKLFQASLKGKGLQITSCPIKLITLGFQGGEYWHFWTPLYINNAEA